MPGRYVFPGGALEPEDERPSGFEEALPDPPAAGLDEATRQRLAAFARAALRETHEETGLLVGRPAPDGGCLASDAGPVWRAFAHAGLAPAFPALRLLARAITPPGLSRRFHARFFLADGALANGSPHDSDELQAVAWYPAGETAALPMPGITREVLRRALAEGAAAPGSRVPLLT